MKSNIIFRHIWVPRQAEVWGNAVFSHGRAKAPSGFHRPFVFSGKGRKRICLCFCESGQDVVIRFRAVAKSPVRTEMRRFVLRKCEERKEYRSVIFLRPVWSMRSRSVCGRKKLVPRGGSGARRGKFMDGNGVGRGREWSSAWADGGAGPDRGYGSKDRARNFSGGKRNAADGLGWAETLSLVREDRRGGDQVSAVSGGNAPPETRDADQAKRSRGA